MTAIIGYCTSTGIRKTETHMIVIMFVATFRPKKVYILCNGFMSNMRIVGNMF